jgi:hypothetical protein
MHNAIGIGRANILSIVPFRAISDALGAYVFENYAATVHQILARGCERAALG